jgi:hypothetical protein
MQKHSGIHILRSERPRKRKGGRRAHSKKQHISQQLHIGLEPSPAGHQSSSKMLNGIFTSGLYKATTVVAAFPQEKTHFAALACAE